MGDNAAVLAGYTREVFATSSEYDFYLLVKPDYASDDRFRAWDTDQQEYVTLNGWMFDIEDAEGFCKGPHDGIMKKEA